MEGFQIELHIILNNFCFFHCRRCIFIAVAIASHSLRPCCERQQQTFNTTCAGSIKGGGNVHITTQIDQ